MTTNYEPESSQSGFFYALDSKQFSCVLGCDPNNMIVIDAYSNNSLKPLNGLNIYLAKSSSLPLEAHVFGKKGVCTIQSCSRS